VLYALFEDLHATLVHAAIQQKMAKSLELNIIHEEKEKQEIEFQILNAGREQAQFNMLTNLFKALNVLAPIHCQPETFAQVLNILRNNGVFDTLQFLLRNVIGRCMIGVCGVM
jgi:hypothetical protein